MPSVSQAQAGLMALASTSYGQKKLRAEGKKPPPQSVAKEYRDADKGRSRKGLPIRAKRKSS
jgi:hypothetical protein